MQHELSATVCLHMSVSKLALHRAVRGGPKGRASTQGCGPSEAYPRRRYKR